MSQMKALIKDSPREGYGLKEIPVPKPKSDEVLIKVTKVAICGSDIALYSWNEVAKTIATLPFIPGHEAVGVVAECGSDAACEGLKVGDRVAVENHFYCGQCYTCQENRGDICAKMDQYGHGRGTMHGGFSEFSIVKAKYCYRLKTDISDDDAVLLEPMGVAHNGVEKINVAGKDVLVLGAGPIGLFAIAAAKAIGASRVIAADIQPERLELAMKMGADVAINSGEESLLEKVIELTSGNGVSRLVEATGAPNVVNNCFKLVRKNAKVVLIGLPKSPIQIENPLTSFLFKSLTVKTVHGRLIWHTWEECERLISEKKVDPRLVISHQFKMSQYTDAFDCLMSGKCCKIVVDPQA